MLFLFANKGRETDVVVSRDGKEIPLKIKPFVLPENRYLMGFSPKEFYGKDSNLVESVSTAEPAASSGLKKGDRIVAIDGDEVTSMRDITNKLAESGGKKLKVTVLRGTSYEEIDITPVKSTYSETYDIGVLFVGNVKGSVFDVIKQSFVSTYAYTREMVYSVVWLFQGKFPLRDMSGPVGIVAAINGAVENESTIMDKFLSLLRMMVFISVGLGISNLLPIPPADGSKLVLLTVEGIRRKPLPAEKEGLIMMAGFIFMMLLFVLILFNDIYNINLGRFSR
jgi:regulator of sigma E protease